MAKEEYKILLKNQPGIGYTRERVPTFMDAAKFADTKPIETGDVNKTSRNGFTKVTVTINNSPKYKEVNIFLISEPYISISDDKLKQMARDIIQEAEWTSKFELNGRAGEENSALDGADQAVISTRKKNSLEIVRKSEARKLLGVKVSTITFSEPLTDSYEKYGAEDSRPYTSEVTTYSTEVRAKDLFLEVEPLNQEERDNNKIIGKALVLRASKYLNEEDRKPLEEGAFTLEVYKGGILTKFNNGRYSNFGLSPKEFSELMIKGAHVNPYFMRILEKLNTITELQLMAIGQRTANSPDGNMVSVERTSNNPWKNFWGDF